MFWQKTRMALLSSLLVLTWALVSQAAPIDFTFSSYRASASANTTGKTDGPYDVTDNDPPIFKAVSIDATVGTAEALAKTSLKPSDPSQLDEVFASAQANADQVSNAYASMVTEFGFVATSPQIRIYYIYNVTLNLYSGGGENAFGGLLVYLEDTNDPQPSGDGKITTVHYLTEEADGIFNQTFDLVPGHEYVLGIGTFHAGDSGPEAGIGAEAGAFASVSLRNFQFDAVPLPPTLLLLGSGLLGLAGLRRFRKK